MRIFNKKELVKRRKNLRIEAPGIKVIRFKNQEVLFNLEKVLEEITKKFKQPSPTPFSKEGEINKLSSTKGGGNEF